MTTIKNVTEGKNKCLSANKIDNYNRVGWRGAGGKNPKESTEQVKSQE